jgi:hypothetical protein
MCLLWCGLCLKEGAVVCGGIHMSNIPSFPYKIWKERMIRSVADLKAGAAGPGQNRN